MKHVPSVGPVPAATPAFQQIHRTVPPVVYEIADQRFLKEGAVWTSSLRLSARVIFGYLPFDTR